METTYPKIIIDGVFFQIAKFKQSGIGQVWQSLLTQWAIHDFAKYLIVLDRDNTAPRIEGIFYCSVAPYDYQQTALDAQMLQQICDAQEADLFISTYYTTPVATPSVFMAYDMIPEIMGCNLEEICWREKHYAISHAVRYLSISQNTARDLIRFFPHIAAEKVTVAHCGYKPIFSPATELEVKQFKQEFNLEKPYFLLIGERIGVNGYKNAISFFKAMSKLANQQEFAVVCVSGSSELEPELATLAEGMTTVLLSLNDEQLKLAYSGAVAYICTSLYEGFGLPILEAMACGCPVIAGRHSSIPEVGGDGVWYIDQSEEFELINALNKVQDSQIRKTLIEQGIQQSQKFSWAKMADIIANVLLTTAKDIQVGSTPAVSPIWGEFRKQQFLLMSVQQELKQAQALANKYQSLLAASQREIDAMKTSKFWKLRRQWFDFKKAIGLPTNEI